MVKKGVQIAFAITLVILSVIATFCKLELIESIIYAIIIPSFILSLISFVYEISGKCETKAILEGKEKKEKLEESRNTYNKEKAAYNSSKYDTLEKKKQAIETLIDRNDQHIDNLNAYLASIDVQILFINCKNICSKVTIFCYVLLFISMILSPYIVQWLSVINLNCITLWSLTLLYVTSEVKSDFCNWLFEGLLKTCKKKADKEVAKQQDK